MSLSSVFPLPKRREPANVPPGSGLALGFSPLYLALIVLTPLSATVLKTFVMTWDASWTIVTAPHVVVPHRLTFGVSLIATITNLAFGLIVARVLVCYRFPGRRLIDVLVDLPSVLPTAVAGIALVALHASNGWISSQLGPLGLKAAFTLLGTVAVLMFIGLSFVVCMVQSVFEDLKIELEEAAASLGATRWQIFIRVILLTLLPALLTGFAPAPMRTTGKYGPIVFIAGNMPMVSEITPLMIYSKLKQFNCTGATAVAVVVFDISFALLLVINLLQAWTCHRGNRNDITERAPELSTTHAVAGA